MKMLQVRNRCQEKSAEWELKFKDQWNATQEGRPGGVTNAQMEAKPWFHPEEESKAVAATLSHIEALQRACHGARVSGAKVAVVLEDDANFAPIEYWPAPLSEMLSTLPHDWGVVNGAPTNSLDSDGFGGVAREYFHSTNGTIHEFGAVAVIYNLDPTSAAKICERATAAGKSAIDVLTSAKQPCQPADMLLCHLMSMPLRPCLCIRPSIS